MERLVRDWEELKRLSLMSAHQLHQLPLSTPGPLPLRSLRWRLHLDLLPAESFGGDESETSRIWIAASRKERLNYENLRNQFLIDPSTLQDTSHPLSLEEDSPWARYHADQDLRTTIMLDVSRTFPEDKYFRQTRVQRCLGDVLFVYAKMHAAMGYRQGMHELLAPLLLAVDVDAVDAVGGNTFFLAEVLDRRFVEHDAFALFDRLMRLCAPWYAAAGPSALVSRCRQ
ncbi:TBC1 domain, member 5, partial [Kickxella alabastrina]